MFLVVTANVKFLTGGEFLKKFATASAQQMHVRKLSVELEKSEHYKFTLHRKRARKRLSNHMSFNINMLGKVRKKNVNRT